jgi:hypothetical protein
MEEITQMSEEKSVAAATIARGLGKAMCKFSYRYGEGDI